MTISTEIMKLCVENATAAIDTTLVEIEGQGLSGAEYLSMKMALEDRLQHWLETIYRMRSDSDPLAETIEL